MDQWFEILVGAIIILSWLAQAIFGGKKDKEGEAPEGDATAAERARRLQEEIRRRIEERRQADGGPVAETAPAQSQPRTFDRSQSSSERAPMRPERGAPLSTPQAPANSMEAQLRQQMEEVRRTEERRKQALEQLKNQRRQQTPAAPDPRVPQTRTPEEARAALAAWGRDVRAYAGFLADLKEGLNDPIDARRAFIYSEVFGPPLGARPARRSGSLSDQY